MRLNKVVVALLQLFRSPLPEFSGPAPGSHDHTVITTTDWACQPQSSSRIKPIRLNSLALEISKPGLSLPGALNCWFSQWRSLGPGSMQTWSEVASFCL